MSFDLVVLDARPDATDAEAGVGMVDVALSAGQPGPVAVAFERGAYRAARTLVALSARVMTPLAVRVSIRPWVRAAVRSWTAPGSAGESQTRRPAGSASSSCSKSRRPSTRPRVMPARVTAFGGGQCSTPPPAPLSPRRFRRAGFGAGSARQARGIRVRERQ